MLTKLKILIQIGHTQKNILYQNMKLYDDKKEEITTQFCMAFWYKVYII